MTLPLIRWFQLQRLKQAPSLPHETRKPIAGPTGCGGNRIKARLQNTWPEKHLLISVLLTYGGRCPQSLMHLGPKLYQTQRCLQAASATVSRCKQMGRLAKGRNSEKNKGEAEQNRGRQRWRSKRALSRWPPCVGQPWLGRACWAGGHSVACSTGEVGWGSTGGAGPQHCAAEWCQRCSSLVGVDLVRKPNSRPTGRPELASELRRMLVEVREWGLPFMSLICPSVYSNVPQWNNAYNPQHSTGDRLHFVWASRFKMHFTCFHALRWRQKLVLDTL